MIFGYACVSTSEQNITAQLEALKNVGAEKIFQEKLSGKNRERPQLEKTLEQLREGDVVIVKKYDRFTRSLRDLIEIVELIKGRDAGFRSIGESIDTTTPNGRLIFHIFGSIAEFERERIIERFREGLASARKNGRVGGRPAALSPDQKTEVQRMRDIEHRSIAEIARLFKVSTSTVRRA